MRTDTILEKIIKERGWRLFGKYYDSEKANTTHRTYCWVYTFVSSKDKNHPFNQGLFAKYDYIPTLQLSVKRNEIKWYYLEKSSTSTDYRILWGLGLEIQIDYYNALLEELEIIKHLFFERTGKHLRIEHEETAKYIVLKTKEESDKRNGE